MENMRYEHQLNPAPALSIGITQDPSARSDWRTGVPSLSGSRVTLRALRLSDAFSLFSMLTTEEVTRFISPPPARVEDFERFILAANREREAGTCFCFAVVPQGMDVAVGLFQVRQIEPTFEIAEWGFALGSAFWGSGTFVEAARLVLNFAFSTVGVHRMEARAAAQNGRGNGALRKIGAIQEGVLRKAFRREGRYDDQVL